MTRLYRSTTMYSVMLAGPTRSMSWSSIMEGIVVDNLVNTGYCFWPLTTCNDVHRPQKVWHNNAVETSAKVQSDRLIVTTHLRDFARSYDDKLHLPKIAFCCFKHCTFSFISIDLIVILYLFLFAISRVMHRPNYFMLGQVLACYLTH